MDGATLVLLLLVALAPPFILAIRLRNAERSRREPWRILWRAFLWGATGAAFLSILAETAIQRALGGASLLHPALLLSVVLVAPVIEETLKLLGLRAIEDRDPEPEDGLIYGGAVGLGFAAAENTLYILSAFLAGGQDLAVATALYRGIATVALHGAASALAGYGLWEARYGGRAWASPRLRRRYGRRLAPAVWGLAAAIGVHGLYNGVSRFSGAFATLGAAALAVVAFLAIIRRVQVLDERGPAQD